MSDNSIINSSSQFDEAAIARCATSSTTGSTLMLVSGDMSGIQPFLYQIVSSKAARNLAGRSCYLDLLGKAVVESLLNALSLDRGHVVCESGGTFVLIAPCSQDVKAALSRAVQFIEEKIFDAHGTGLSVAIDSVEITVDEACAATVTLAQRWTDLFFKREARKNAKHSSLMSRSYDRFFKPTAVSGDKRDAITGEDITGTGCRVNDVGVVTRVNKLIIDLGAEMRKGCIPVLVRDEEDTGNDFVIEPAGLGVKFRMMKNAQAPRVDTFEQMCENEDALERLGVLRMDVDNLGSRFQEYARTQSLAAYSALSHELDDFFKKRVREMCVSNECYLLYGGGDDLFVVGEWRHIIKLAAIIKTEFSQWAQNRGGEWSLSGGVAIVKAKYPIIEGAKRSGQEEDLAKSHACAGQVKNSISLMSTPLNWDKEFVAVSNLKNRLVDLLENDELAKSFLKNVLLQTAKAELKHHKVTQVSIYWQLNYDIKRAMERAKGKEKALALLEQCREEICTPGNKLGGQDITTDYHLLELWALACRWAELEYRSNNNHNQ